MSETPSIVQVRVCDEHLREIYWDEDIKGRLERGELIEAKERSIVKQRQEGFVDRKGKLCVKYGILALMDPNDPDVDVALLHYFLTDTGEIGTSGEYDPKELTIGGIQYRQRRTGGGNIRPCEICSGNYEHKVSG